MQMTTTQTGSAGRWGPLWGAKPHDWQLTEQQQFPAYANVIHRLGIQPGQKVLDVGCGAGTFLRMVAAAGADAFGFDASQTLLDLARIGIPTADLRNGDMQSLPYDDHFFDVVTGFNSFFYAADMIAALREAGRVAKPGAPIVMVVWGRPEHCSLSALRGVLEHLLPPPNPNAPPPPKLWQEGVLENIVTKAGLVPEERFEIHWAFQYPDTETMVKLTLAPGIVVEAVRHSGEAAVRKAIVEGLAPFQTADGAYLFEHEGHCLIARAG